MPRENHSSKINESSIAIIVLGMHRSGTSALTRVISLLGADLPNDLMPPTKKDNEKGFWESRYLGELHESFFQSIGMSWKSLQPLEPNWTKTLLADKYRKLFLEFLKDNFSTSDFFVLKDPRLCRLMPLWIDVFEEFGVTPRFIIPLRDPLEVAESLFVRDGIPLEISMILWLKYNLDAEFHSRNFRRSYVTYESLLNDWRTVIDMISNDLAIAWPRTISIAQTDIDHFLTPGLRHHNRNIASLNNKEGGWVKNTYQILLGLTQDPKKNDLLESIDAIQREVVLAENSFGKIVRVLDSNIQEYEFEIQRLNEAILSEQTTSRKNLTNLNRTVEKLQLAVDGLENNLIQNKAEQDLLREEMNRKSRDYEVILQQFREKQSHIKYLTEQLNIKDKSIKILEDKNSLEALNNRRISTSLKTLSSKIVGIEKSISYKLGRTFTFPFRFTYELLIRPFYEYPENFQLVFQLMRTTIQHPFKVLRLINIKFITNIFITFFKSPRIAFKVVSHYQQLLNAAEAKDFEQRDFERERIESLENERDQVSVICLNYNGLAHLPDILTSLQEQDYDDLEIILVDNGSSDHSVEYVSGNFPGIKIIALKENVGYAEANNIAVEVASGKYLCLVNNDGVASQNMISNLVSCMKKSRDIGAVGAKILFWTKFVVIELEIVDGKGSEKVLFDELYLSHNLPVYSKWFLGEGWDLGASDSELEGMRTFSGKASLKVAICEGQENIPLRFSTSSHTSIALKIKSNLGDIQSVITLNHASWQQIELDFSGRLDDNSLKYVVNNVGTLVSSDGDVKDRGFGEIDYGQFDKTRNIDALCGCTMLIRRSALGKKPLFIGQFFAYFEDTELSLRLLRDGHTLKYCHNAVFYHKHASTSVENSAFFKFYVHRNRLLFLAIHFAEMKGKLFLKNAREHLNHLQDYYLSNPDVKQEEREFGAKITQILSDWSLLLPRIEDDRIYERTNYFPTIGIYNNFWHTLGGGEHHACIVCQALQSFGPVDLISENDFSIESLEIQFDVNLKYCRKKLVSAPQLHHDASVTGSYDLFINSTFGSDLVSHAKQSIYLVSFPYKIDPSLVQKREFLKSYEFWANSKYTQTWIKRWWNVSSEVVYPSVYVPNISCLEDREKTILHVGRFFEVGHNKKQLEITKIFCRLVDENKIGDWRLVLVGQVADDDFTYVEKVRVAGEGYSVEIKNNLPLTELRQLLSKAAIYIHATGLGEANDKNPELNEHFGISTVEAMAHGCVPVVIDRGGQPEIVKDNYNGFLFRDELSALSTLSTCISLFEENREKFVFLQKNARLTAAEFSRERTIDRIVGSLSNDRYTKSNLL